jgi:hypothetical protein
MLYESLFGLRISADISLYYRAATHLNIDHCNDTLKSGQ